MRLWYAARRLVAEHEAVKNRKLDRRGSPGKSGKTGSRSRISEPLPAIGKLKDQAPASILSADPNAGHESSSIENHLIDLKLDLARLERRLGQLDIQKRGVKRKAAAANSASILKIHFSRSFLDRKPFLLSISGSVKTTKKLSPVRTAIMVVLLTDYIKTSEGSFLRGDPQSEVLSVLKLIAPAEAAEVTTDAIRMALHRISGFIKEELNPHHPQSFRFDYVDFRLKISAPGSGRPPEKIEMTSDDPAISSLLTRMLQTTPLLQLRRGHSAFIPAGEEGMDRLGLELIDHPFPVTLTTLFYRPTVYTMPPSLGEKIGFGPNRRRRQMVALQGIQSGRIAYRQIMQRRVLAEHVQSNREKKGRFSPYGTVEHLDYMLYMLRSYPSFQLILTDAFFPFYVSNLEVIWPEKVERLLMFFQHEKENSLYEISTFCIADDCAYFGLESQINDWVMNHPSTTARREEVISELDALRRRAVPAGEIKPGTRRPGAESSFHDSSQDAVE